MYSTYGHVGKAREVAESLIKSFDSGDANMNDLTFVEISHKVKSLLRQLDGGHGPGSNKHFKSLRNERYEKQ